MPDLKCQECASDFRWWGHWHNWLASTFSGPESHRAPFGHHGSTLPNPPRTVEELTIALVEVWQDIDLGTICRLIRSMLWRCRACIQARGDHTHYQYVISIWLNEWLQFWDKSMSWLSPCFFYMISGFPRQMVIPHSPWLVLLSFAPDKLRHFYKQQFLNLKHSPSSDAMIFMGSLIVLSSVCISVCFIDVSAPRWQMSVPNHYLTRWKLLLFIISPRKGMKHFMLYNDMAMNAIASTQLWLHLFYRSPFSKSLQTDIPLGNGKGVYQKGWPLHMETDAGPVLSARSRVECCMKCRAIVGCTGVDYFPDTLHILQCHLYGILSNINLP